MSRAGAQSGGWELRRHRPAPTPQRQLTHPCLLGPRFHWHSFDADAAQHQACPTLACMQAITRCARLLHCLCCSWDWLAAGRPLQV